MLDRRGFFKSIAGLFVATAIHDPKKLLADIGAAYSPDLSVGDLSTAPNPLNAQMQKLTEYMHVELVDSLNRIWPEVGSEARLGEGPTQQLVIDFSLTSEMLGLPDEMIRARYVRPAVNRLRDRIREDGATRFYLPLLPCGIDFAARVSGKGVALRGLMAWDPHADLGGLPANITRFDVLYS